MIDEVEVTNLCNKYNLKCHVFHDRILIDSPFRDWICEQRGNIYRLKHINGKTCGHHSHVHNKIYQSLPEVIDYIHKHDTQVALNRDVNRKLERLYSQI